MSEKPKVPQGFSVQGRDGSAFVKWDHASGIYGYKLFFYSADEPDKVIKAVYVRKSGRCISGFRNNHEYFAEICAYSMNNGREIMGQRSERKSFTPHVLRLKAQKTMVLGSGMKKQISWESAAGMPPMTFSSDNSNVASVDSTGMVTAKLSGSTRIRLTSVNDNQSFVTKVIVDRKCVPAENRAVLMFTGEIMCTAKQQKMAGYGFDFSDSFRQLRNILSEADFSAGVLETVCCDDQPYEYEQSRTENGVPNCNSPSSFIAAVSDCGFDAVITSANNRTYGTAGLLCTTNRVKSCGMSNVGTAGDNPFITDIRGIRTAVIACTMVSNRTEQPVEDICCENPYGVYSREYFTGLVDKARRAGAEYIVVFMHWGAVNTSQVRKHQTEEAQFIADSGADIIIGSHPHMLQSFKRISTEDGRSVPCAYSMGNILSSMSEFESNRDGAVLRVELCRNADGINTRVSYIPFMTEERPWGFEAVPVMPVHSSESAAALERIQTAFGKKIKPFSSRPKFFLSGSKLLGRIFSCGNGFRTSRSAMLLSQLSLGSFSGKENMFAASPDFCGDNARLKLDLSKKLSEVIRESGADYCAVDFLSAASASCYKLPTEPGAAPVFFTDFGDFRQSSFFNENRQSLEKIKPPFGEAVWKPLIERYAGQLLEVFPAERIILFRYKFGNRAVKANELRNCQPPKSLNRFVREMEEYFISLVSPRVVDLSGNYFTDGSKGMEYEPDYYQDAYNAVVRLTDGSCRTCIRLPDEEIWFGRVMKYYRSMTARACYGWLLDMECAADLIIAYTSAEFAGRNKERLMRLRRSGNCQLSAVRNFFDGDKGAEEIVRAADIINALLNGHTDRSYDFFEPAFRGHYSIIRRLVRLLSAEIGVPVNEESAELAFLLRGKPQLKRYVASLNRMTLDIWGSCVSRESANRSCAAHIGTYIVNQPPVLAFEPPVGLTLPDNPEAFCGSRWRKRTLFDSLMHSGDADIKGSDAQWILLDFYGLINRMAEYKGGLFAIDDFILRTDFYKEIKPDCRECYIFEKRDMKFCFEMMTRFARLIAEKYSGHIILIKTEPKDSFIDLDNRLRRFEDDVMYEIKKKFIALCEERFASVTGCYVIDISKHFYSSDSYPFGGADIVHYEDEFYRQTGRYIDEIIGGTDKRVFSTVDENYLLLRNMRLRETAHNK